MRYFVLEGNVTTEVCSPLSVEIIDRNAQIKYWDYVANSEIHRTFLLESKSEVVEKLKRLDRDRYRVFCLLRSSGLLDKKNKIILM